jgi:hypothetical protein
MPCRQWALRDSARRTAFLYLATTASVKTIIRWSGELGYQGEGYLVQGRGSRVLRLSTGSAARVSVVRIERLDAWRVLAYAVGSPDGIAAHGTDDLLRTGWEALRGTAGPYYLVRVAAVERTQAASTEVLALGLLAHVLPALQLRLDAGAR